MEPDPMPPDPIERQRMLLAYYGEVCRGHHAITDFRSKLLALLPLATGAGAYALLGRDMPERLPAWLGPLGLFGLTVTFGLFLYELRQVRECIRLRLQAAVVEDHLDIPPGCGVFRDNPSYGLRGIVTAEMAGWFVYAAVMGFWGFLAVSGFGWGGLGPLLAVAVLAVIAAKAVYLASRPHRPVDEWLGPPAADARPTDIVVRWSSWARGGTAGD